MSNTNSQKGKRILAIEYYNQAFCLLHRSLEKEGFETKKPPPVRKRFWTLLPNRTYDSYEAVPILEQYQKSIEREMSEIISKHSIAYWLHIYRRLFPGPIGRDNDPATIKTTRATLEAAIQKYAQFKICNGVGFTRDTAIENVLGGLLMSDDFKNEREGLKKNNELVLTKFVLDDLREFYNLEMLAYEMWRASAMRRIINKGAKMRVDNSEEKYYDLRSEELNELVVSYDSRSKRIDKNLMSSLGVVGEDVFTVDIKKGGIIFCLEYNLGGVTFEDLSPFFKDFRIKIETIGDGKPNFILVPIALKQFRDAHLPYANNFRLKYRVGLDEVLIVISTLLYRTFFLGRRSIYFFWRCLQRSYEGPSSRESVIDEIKSLMPRGAELLGIDEKYLKKIDITKAIDFWELNEEKRKGINLVFPGPHYVFLPLGEDRYFIDYANILNRLHYLFVGLTYPPQNFKGDYLENLVRYKKSELPVKKCKATNGEYRQIDAAFSMGKRLIIIECRVFVRSIGFIRGDSKAINWRNKRVNKALNDIDEKAHWLAKNPIGRNYNISKFKEILPLAVSSFVEYIPSISSYYWINKKYPRVLTAGELKELLKADILVTSNQNIVSIS